MQSEAAPVLDELGLGWLVSARPNEAEPEARTLANRYNARPTWLANAHAALD